MEMFRPKEESVIVACVVDVVVDDDDDVVVVVYEGRKSRLGDNPSMDQECVWKDARADIVDEVDAVDHNIVNRNTVDRSTVDRSNEDGVVDGILNGVAVAVGVMVMAVDVDYVPVDRDPWLDV